MAESEFTITPTTAQLLSFRHFDDDSDLAWVRQLGEKCDQLELLISTFHDNEEAREQEKHRVTSIKESIRKSEDQLEYLKCQLLEAEQTLVERDRKQMEVRSTLADVKNDIARATT